MPPPAGRSRPARQTHRHRERRYQAGHRPARAGPMDAMNAWKDTRPLDETAAAFAALMRERDEALPLDRAAALLARGIAYPDLDVEAIVAQLDDVAAGLRPRLPLLREPFPMVEALRRYLGE